MSIFDRAPHEVYIIRKVKKVDRYGQSNDTSENERIGPIRCSIQPYTSGQNNVSGVKIKAYGTQVKTGYTILTRGDEQGVWPGGPASVIEWNGVVYQQDGEAQLFSMSPNTWHYQVGMTRQNVEMV